MKEYADSESAPWEVRREYQDICSTYASMLGYFRQGIPDPGRDNLFTRLCGRALTLGDRCRLLPHAATAQKESFGDASLWDASQMEKASQKLCDRNERVDNCCVLISSLTMSLLRIFDPAKVNVLCEAVASEHDEVAVRAVTALAIVVRQYAERLPFYPEVEARLRLLADDTLFMEMLSDVELQFIRSRDTEKIERKMNEDIIPAMLRNPGAKGKTIITSDELMEGSNPEWEKWLKDTGIEDKLKELTEWQMEGADIYMATFSHLKSYPFFNEMENWFRPFDPEHPALASLATGKQFNLSRLIMRSAIFCNSDKYSFCLSLNSLPESQRELLSTQMPQQQEAELEELLEKNLSSKKPSARTLVRQYIQDLYRFFHLYPSRKSFPNPFATAGALNTGDPLHTLYEFPSQSLLAALELNFQRHDFEASISGFQLLQSCYPDRIDATLWQKYGYCLQQTNHYYEACKALRMADVMRPDQYWTTLHLAQCHRYLNHYAEALTFFERAAQMKPDNLQIDYQQATCLINLDRYDEALALLHKIAYHEPDSLKVQRAIIRSYLMSHQPAKAAKYVTHILDEPTYELTDEDLHLIAAVQWLRNDRTAAFRTLQALGKQPTLPLLASLGIPDDDLTLLRECLL